MPTTYTFTEKYDRRRASAKQGGRGYTRVYQLITSARVSEADAMLYVLDTQTLVPTGLNVGDPHPDDSGVVVVNVEAEDAAADGQQWDVTIEWAYAVAGSISPDPFSRPPEVTWSQSPETVEFFKDYSSTPLPILNSAGQKFDELPQRERGVLSLRYVTNHTEEFFRGTLLPLMAYEYIVNSESFTIDGVSIPALYARLEIDSAERITEGSTTFRRVAYVLKFRQGNPGFTAEGWREFYDSRGHYQHSPDTIDGIAVLEPIRDNDGQIVEQPWPLDSSGLALASSDATPAVVGPFKAYPEVDFADLSFA